MIILIAYLNEAVIAILWKLFNFSILFLIKEVFWSVGYKKADLRLKNKPLKNKGVYKS